MEQRGVARWREGNNEVLGFGRYKNCMEFNNEALEAQTCRKWLYFVSLTEVAKKKIALCGNVVFTKRLGLQLNEVSKIKL